MIMPIRPEVIPFIVAVAVVFGLFAFILRMRKAPAKRVFRFCVLPAAICAAYLLFFFRDPERMAPADPAAVVAGADGRVMSIVKLEEKHFLKTECLRISIFLSLFDVHVNRAPIAGRSTFLGYFPGKRLFTFREKSSELNQHNKILVEGAQTRCLVNQIVGPFCRRVVYWPDHDKPVNVLVGERIGMMKFGSRLDMYLPADDVEIICKPGDVVRAGETIVARTRRK